LPYGNALETLKIASLVPSATEALFALGMGDSVVAVTHECDWPAEALELPRITRSEIPDGLAPREIDAAVRDLTGEGRAIYGLDSAELERLAPDLIVTQALCAVCAVSYDDV
jgi:iron complex transport system substrate-binding protein